MFFHEKSMCQKVSNYLRRHIERNFVCRDTGLRNTGLSNQALWIYRLNATNTTGLQQNLFTLSLSLPSQLHANLIDIPERSFGWTKLKVERGFDLIL
jgi:hypothetical protein